MNQARLGLFLSHALLDALRANLSAGQAMDVLTYVAHADRDTGVCGVGLGRLAERFGSSRFELSRALCKLEKAGLVRRLSRGSRRGAGTVDVSRLLELGAAHE